MTNKKYDVYIGILPGSYLAEIISTDITCPLGQLVIASYARERVEGLESVVFNGEKTNDDEILARAHYFSASGKNVLAGITLNTGNTRNAFNLAQKLSAMSADVIVGGPEATMVGEAVLRNRPYIRATVLGTGEKTVTGIIKNGIARRVYDGGHRLDFENIRIDYDSLFDLDKHNGVTYLWGNDCQNAKQRCYFCGRISLGVGFRAPSVVWGELLRLYHKGFRHFYNNTDTVAVSPRELRRFVDAKPREMTEDHHKVFINASQVNQVTVPLLKKLNSTAHIGIENPALYELIGKGGSSLKDNETALIRLKKAEIPVVLSFVIGMPGENEQTLEENKKYIEFVVREYGEIIEQVLVSPLMLTSGSRAYHDLMSEPEMRDKYNGKILPFDVVEMSEDYFRLQTAITRRRALEWIKVISGIAKNISSGIKVDTKGIPPAELDYLTK